MTYENFTIVPTSTNARFTDLEGQRFGMLVVLGYLGPNKWRKPYWLCRCDCGTLHPVIAESLVRANTDSCGCQKAAKVARARTTHGGRFTPEYNVWCGMKSRCNPTTKHSDQDRKIYIERDITVCAGWKTSFESFFADMGERPSPEYSIERIKNHLGYWCGHCDECVELGHPNNCEWATKPVQNNNRRSNRNFTIHDVTMNLTQWANHFDIPPSRVSARLKYGWSIEDALTRPLRYQWADHQTTTSSSLSSL